MTFNWSNVFRMEGWNNFNFGPHVDENKKKLYVFKKRLIINTIGALTNVSQKNWVKIRILKNSKIKGKEPKKSKQISILYGIKIVNKLKNEF